MFLYIPIGGGGTSTDPGVDNVLAPASGGPASYQINGVTLTGTLSLDFPTASQVADAVWSKSMAPYTDTSTFGGFVQKILTVAKFLGLQ